jgi:glycosyltransferase involved in cell wall biosynthesis
MDGRSGSGEPPPRISVVMATYDGARFLREMLESLATQTRVPDELVVRDDASADQTLAILRDFAAGAPFPVDVVVGDRRLGYAGNFVTAAGRAGGDLVFFADQDDTWRPEKIATVADRYEPETSRAYFHDFALMSDTGTETAPSYYGLLTAHGFGPPESLKGCSMAVTRTFLETWGWPPAQSRVSHDFWVALLATAYGQRRYAEEILIDHRLHADNASGWIPSSRSRVFTHSGDHSSDVDVLIDLVIKRRKVRRWTKAFLEVVAERGGDVDPAASIRLRRSLRRNRKRHLEADVAS